MKVIKGLGEKYNLTVGTFGHAGDGNLHLTFMCDKRDKDEFERVERAVDELFNTTIEMGGTLSGEHGIGTAKQKWLEKGNLTRHHRVLAPPAQGHRPEGPVQPQQAGWSLNHG